MPPFENPKKCHCGANIVERTSTTFQHPNMRQLICENHFEGSTHFRKWLGGHTCNEGCLVKQDIGHEQEWNGKKRFTANDFKKIETENNLLRNDLNNLMETVEGLQLTNADMSRRLAQTQDKCQTLRQTVAELRKHQHSSESAPCFGVPLAMIFILSVVVMLLLSIICFRN